MKFEKHGGMWFWRIGRLGGTFYVTRKQVKRAKLAWWPQVLRRRKNTAIATVIVGGFCLYLKTLV